MGKDQGLNVRHKVHALMEFVQNDDLLREERKKAKKNKDKYVGMSSGGMGGRFGEQFFQLDALLMKDVPINPASLWPLGRPTFKPFASPLFSVVPATVNGF